MKPPPLIAGLLGLVLGCAFPTEPLSMVPRVSGAAQKELASVNVQGLGGARTRLWGKSQISNAALTEAVQRAVAEARVFIPVEDRVGDYQLEVEIERLEQPTWSLLTTVHVHTRWSLSRTGRPDPIWTEHISGRFTTTLLDAMIGTKRCRLATEGAAREAIREGVERLALRQP